MNKSDFKIGFKQTQQRPKKRIESIKINASAIKQKRNKFKDSTKSTIDIV
jgi:hypothetical protein